MRRWLALAACLLVACSSDCESISQKEPKKDDAPKLGMHEQVPNGEASRFNCLDRASGSFGPSAAALERNLARRESKVSCSCLYY
jgi:hypothetical protein